MNGTLLNQTGPLAVIIASFETHVIHKKTTQAERERVENAADQVLEFDFLRSDMLTRGNK